MDNLITAKGLSKKFGSFHALNDLNFSIERGQIYGLIGPNGAGKTTLLKVILGLSTYSGELDVMGLSPRNHRKRLMKKMCFIADITTLPQWLTAKEAIYFIASVHPQFDSSKAHQFLTKTDIPLEKPVSALSKGMTAQLHLALVMSIDVDVLVLDEPTLGLDILYRKQFYQSLLSDYFTDRRSIIITTHQIDEVESILTHIIMINKGKLLLNESMEELGTHFVEVTSSKEHSAALEALKPLYYQQKLAEITYLYENIDPKKLEQYGKVNTPSVSNIFAAKVLGERQ